VRSAFAFALKPVLNLAFTSRAATIAYAREPGHLRAVAAPVVELGAGCALPSVLLSTLAHPRTPALVVPTDYPDPLILGNLRRNVERNAPLAAPGCRVECKGHAWGDEASIGHVLSAPSHQTPRVLLF
jgi:EEF1A N-terminal glycine/lysine methyltransferase